MENANESIEVVKSNSLGTWIGKYRIGDTSVDRDGQRQDIVYYADSRRNSPEEAFLDALALKNLSNDPAGDFERDGF